MKIMEVVWPLTALWSSFFGLWVYKRIGRSRGDLSESATMDMRMDASMDMHMDMQMENKAKMGMPMCIGKRISKKLINKKIAIPLKTITISTLHCGAGCTLADIIGEWGTLYVPIALFGSIIIGSWILDYILALIIGVGFQYAAIQPMEHLPVRKAICKAFKIDFWSLTSWQIGMYGWMAILFFVFDLALPKSSWEFWFMMQIAMGCGFITAFPMNYLLIKCGIKKGM